jgi:hypothetical protein
MDTITRPSLREIVLDALTDAYWTRKREVEDCEHCRRSAAGVCPDEDHQLSTAAFLFYEEARKRIEHMPADPEVMDVLCGNVMAALSGSEGEGS